MDLEAFSFFVEIISAQNVCPSPKVQDSLWVSVVRAANIEVADCFSIELAYLVGISNGDTANYIDFNPQEKLNTKATK